MGDGVMPIFAGSVFICWLLTQIRVYLDKHLTNIYHSLKLFYCPGLVSRIVIVMLFYNK